MAGLLLIPLGMALERADNTARLLDVAPGLYVYHVDAPGLGTHVDKFAIIK